MLVPAGLLAQSAERHADNAKVVSLNLIQTREFVFFFVFFFAQ